MDEGEGKEEGKREKGKGEGGEEETTRGCHNEAKGGKRRQKENF